MPDTILSPDESFAATFASLTDRLRQIILFRLDPRLRRRIDPDDIVQEVYLRASQRYAQYRTQEEVPLFVWLRQIACQTVIDLHRRHIRAKRRDVRRDRPLVVDGKLTSAHLTAHLIAPLTSPSHAAMRSELARRVRAALERMSELDREVLSLRHFEELSNAEIAIVLGITEKTASIRYVRAIARLRRVMADLPGFTEFRHGEANHG